MMRAPMILAIVLSACGSGSADDPSAASITDGSPTVAAPTTTETSADPTSADPTSADPTSADPTSADPTSADSTDNDPATTTGTTEITTSSTNPPLVPDELPGMPPVLDAGNVYSGTGVGKLSEAVADTPALIYVPTNDAGNVTVIDQATFAVVDEYTVGNLAQHVTPSWDLTTLYANASGYNQLVPIDPRSGKPGDPIPVDAPYNLYFTPDGESAIVMAERRNRIDYYDPNTWERKFSIPTPCDGPNHADWTIDGQSYWVTCEFSSQLLRVSTDGTILDVLDIPGGKPQDLRLLPDGSAFYLADMNNARILILDAETNKITGTIETGQQPHGIYPSRDGQVIYVSNRGSGTVSVIDWRTDHVIDTWTIPGGGSPDMGGVSADGSVLWLAGRFDDEVYAFDTATGELLAKIPVAAEPHGLTVWPQPGRYSLGHTGNLR